MIKEDIRPGYAPQEISFRGYTTKNLHHSPDAALAFQDTIDRFGTKNPKEILTALKATDTYMKLNDLHLEQGKSPDEKEVNKWKVAHEMARDALNQIREFPHHQDYHHMHEHELQDLLIKYNVQTAGAEMTDSYEPKGTTLEEELTDKTIRQSDKIKVARVIGDMLGIENVETMSPDIAVNTGLRKIRNKRMTPELSNVLRKMVNLSQEVGIKIDQTLLPKELKEATVAPIKPNSYNSDIMLFKDYIRLLTLNTGAASPEEKKPAPEADEEDTAENIPKQAGHTMGDTNDQLRRRKIKYRLESKEYSEKEEDDNDADDLDLSEKELDKIADSVDSEDDILDAYDEDEFKMIDKDTGEEVEDEKKPVNEETLNEVLSRAERIKARLRFMRTAAKRERRLQLVLKRHSDMKTISRRARHLAVKLLKERLLRKPISQMTVAEKERVEAMLAKRKALIDRLAMRLVPRIRKIEAERLSHQHEGK